MKATCSNDLTHDRFSTTAHVLEEWVVTADGSYVQTLGVLETVHEPSADNYWQCHICGAPALVD